MRPLWWMRAPGPLPPIKPATECRRSAFWVFLKQWLLIRFTLTDANKPSAASQTFRLQFVFAFLCVSTWRVLISRNSEQNAFLMTLVISAPLITLPLIKCMPLHPFCGSFPVYTNQHSPPRLSVHLRSICKRLMKADKLFIRACTYSAVMPRSL